MIGVDVDLDDFVVGDEHEAVAAGIQKRSERRGVGFGRAADHDQLGTVTEADILGFVIGKVGGCLLYTS